MQSALVALAEPKSPLLLSRQMQLVKQSPKTEAIIFDMDGVLVSSRKAAASALFTVAMSEGVKVDEAMVINALDRGNSALSIVSCPCPT